MATVNLEKSLLKENKKLAPPIELLLIDEYEKMAELANNEALSRVGLNQSIKEGEAIKRKILSKQEQTKNFNQERVFHISQIKAICTKYHLRFLHSKFYKGAIDADLPNRIQNFEISYGVECTKENTRIVAPKESFELQKNPKDPLMFYEINDEYFYLIHKWGKDLNTMRTIMPYLSNAFICWLVLLFILPLPALLIGTTSYLFTLGFVFIVSSLWQVLSYDEDSMIRFFSVNNWQSEYR